MFNVNPSHLLLSSASLEDGSFLARLAKLREGSRCLFSSTLKHQVSQNKEQEELHCRPGRALCVVWCDCAPLLARCYLVFLDIVTVLSGASVLGPNSSPTSFDLSAISSIRTLCRVSLSFSLIPSLGLKTPRKRGSSSGVSGSRWAPTMVIFCCDLGQKHGVRRGQSCRAVR